MGKKWRYSRHTWHLRSEIVAFKWQLKYWVTKLSDWVRYFQGNFKGQYADIPMNRWELKRRSPEQICSSERLFLVSIAHIWQCSIATSAYTGMRPSNWCYWGLWLEYRLLIWKQRYGRQYLLLCLVYMFVVRTRCGYTKIHWLERFKKIFGFQCGTRWPRFATTWLTAHIHLRFHRRSIGCKTRHMKRIPMGRLSLISCSEWGCLLDSLNTWQSAVTIWKRWFSIKQKSIWDFQICEPVG